MDTFPIGVICPPNEGKVVDETMAPVADSANRASWSCTARTS